MTRALSLIATLWVLLVAPAFCLGGLLEHPCSDCPEGEPCHHEDECLDDPCGDLAVVRTSDDAASSLAAAPALALAIDAPHVEAPARPAGGTIPTRQNLPHPPSDRPLLI